MRRRALALLILDVCLDYIQRSPTAGGDEIGATPQHRLGVGSRQISKLLTHAPRGDCFECVDQLGQLHRGWVVHQQVNMIGIPVAFLQGCTSLLADLLGSPSKGFVVQVSQNLAPVFRHEDDMGVQQIGGMAPFLVLHTDNLCWVSLYDIRDFQGCTLTA